jgi:hypothetical protein
MRFIIHELPYERPVAAGKLVYEQDGRPTGAVESWRLTDAVDGYGFLRVDLDARQAASGQSTLYHLTLNPAGKPEQLKYRLWKPELAASGMVLWENDGLFIRQQSNHLNYEEVRKRVPLWFPATSGLALLVQTTLEAREVSAVLLRPDLAVPEATSILLPACVAISRRSQETVMVMGRAILADVFTIAWDGQERALWLDEHGRPLKMQRNDGLTAVAVQLVEYI